MSLIPGTRLRSAVSTCEVIVIRAPKEATALLCGGVEMGADLVPPKGDAQNAGEPIELGKRYSDESGGLEVLCVTAGNGPLTYDGVELRQKVAKPLPASD